jgi:hypothetical protein
MRIEMERVDEAKVDRGLRRPRGEVREPPWSKELMSHYWSPAE